MPLALDVAPCDAASVTWRKGGALRRLLFVLSVAALVAVAGCTPTTSPTSTVASTTTTPAQAVREAIVPARVPIDSAYYPAGATISAISFDTCSTLGYTTYGNVRFPLSQPACADGFPTGPSAESPPVPLREGLTQYGAYGGTSPAVAAECVATNACFDYFSTTLLRIRW
jgi:hypothetical protein